MAEPKFSIITPTFNQAEFIRDTIESVRGQHYPNYEHLIIDGGSTDGTVEILKEYPHLQWISEPDRGQADAINKGFARATGDIITWLNSDDWFAPGIFAEVVQALSQYPVVLGGCEITDRNRRTIMTVPNLERTWFDMLKSWVPYAIPAQPSIFLRRDALEAVRYPDGSFVDESFHFLMDYDLWMRLARLYPFKVRIPHTLSYYRMYEDNKTSMKVEGMPYAEPEMSRVFQRAVASVTPIERMFSIVIFCDPKGDTARIEALVRSVQRQKLQDYEVLLVDRSGDRAHGRAVRKLAAQFSDENRAAGTGCMVRPLSVEPAGGLAQLNPIIQAARSKILLFIETISDLPPNALLEASKVFASDRVALVMPDVVGLSIGERLFTPQGELKVEGVFGSPYIPRDFFLRKIAAMDIGGFTPYPGVVFGARELFVGLHVNGWQMRVLSTLAFEAPEEILARDQEQQVYSNYVNAQILVDINALRQRETHAHLPGGFEVVTIPPPLLEQSRRMLERAPQGWSTGALGRTLEDAQRLTSDFPSFAPGWYLLAQQLMRQGDSHSAQKALQRMQEERKKEIS